MYIFTQSGFTPLHAASGKGHSDVVKTLIQNGADINLVSKVWRLLPRITVGALCDHFYREGRGLLIKPDMKDRLTLSVC